MLTIKQLAGVTRRALSCTTNRPRRLAGKRMGPLALGAAAVGMLVIAAGATGAVGAAGVDIATVEGQTFGGTVVSGLSCPLSSATITWGDGTTSPGTSDGSTGIQGTHTYAEEGTYSGSVSYTYTQPAQFRCPSGTSTATFVAAAQDASLTSGGDNIAVAAGQSLSGVVAHFSDADPAASDADFSVGIDWGDGSRSAGTVVPGAAGGGFDVTGAHTYGTAGDYTITSTIVDAGGAATTASSEVHVTAGTPLPLPLPLPVLPPLARPQARFVFAPVTPCQSQHVIFDASGSTGEPSSTGAPLPITEYRWTFDESAFAPSVVAATVPTLDHPFRASSYGPGPYEGPLPNPRGNLFDYRFFRPPALVTLEVTDSAGKTASVSERITFRDPVRVIPEIVPIDPQTGVPDFTHPHVDRNDPRFKHAIPCAKLPTFKLVSSAKLKLGEIKLAAAYAVVRASSASIAVKAPCASGPVNCFGALIVTAETKARRGGGPRNRWSLANSLGHTTFFVAPGRTGTVIVTLSARGRDLIRTRRLRSVTVALRSPGSSGRLVTTTRVVPLHFLP